MEILAIFTVMFGIIFLTFVELNACIIERSIEPLLIMLKVFFVMFCMGLIPALAMILAIVTMPL